MPLDYDNPDFDMVPRQEPAEPRWAWWIRPRLIALVTVIGLLLRLWAAWQLPIDADEPVYLTAAHDYAVLIDQGDVQGVIDYRENSEHPPLSKLLYSGVLLLMGDEPAMDRALFSARLVSVFFGTLTVFVIALIDPLAGFFAAVQTLMIKYTSEVYLEALPQFACLLALYAVLKSKQAGDKWLWLSAGCLGLAAAGKFSYFPILVPVLYIALRENWVSRQKLVLYLLSAAVVFFALNPALWRDPFDRLISALFYHVDYSQSQHVQTSGYNWFQPFVWVSRSWGYSWHSNVFFYFGIDALIGLLGIAGAVMEWNKRRWLAVWIATSMLFLVLWPTRWPQYTLMVLPAFCVAAAPAYRAAARWVMEQENNWGWFQAMIPHPTRALRTALLAGGILFAIVYLGYRTWLGIQRTAWSQLTTQTSPLPSNTVYDLLPLPDGRMVIATAGGAAVWSPPNVNEPINNWEIFTPLNSGLRNHSVLTAEISPNGEFWFGTVTGIDIYDPGTGQWSAANLPEAQVNDIAFSSDGKAWAATSLGAMVVDASKPTVRMQDRVPELSDFLFSVAVQPGQGLGDSVWFGEKHKITRYDGENGWQSYGSAQTGLGVGSVSDLLVDSSGRVWASSTGGGIACWDGSSWTSYRLDNSNLPGSIIQDLYEYPDGRIWASIAFPNTSGGVIAYLKDEDWVVVRSNTSGYSGSETTAMAADTKGRLWFGTITAGVDVWEGAWGEK